MGYAARSRRVSGVVSSGSGSTLCGKGVNTSLMSISGAGYLYLINMFTAASTDSHLCRISLIIDGITVYPTLNSYELSIYGFDAGVLPLSLGKYNNDGLCMQQFFFPNGINFNSSLNFRVYNGSGTDDVNCTGSWIYTLI